MDGMDVTAGALPREFVGGGKAPMASPPLRGTRSSRELHLIDMGVDIGSSVHALALLEFADANPDSLITKRFEY